MKSMIFDFTVLGYFVFLTVNLGGAQHRVNSINSANVNKFACTLLTIDSVRGQGTYPNDGPLKFL
jgi:hypothetical protein